MTQLGDALAEERRRQGKTLVEVEAATRIRGRMLEALEHGSYDVLPAPAYVKGYIQSYARYLDMPAQPLLDMYKADMRFADERAAERERLGPVMPRGARYSKASRQNLDDLPADPVVPKRDQVHAIPTRTWLMVAAGIIVVFMVIWGVSRLGGGPSTPSTVPPTVAETTTVDAAGAVPSETAGATGTSTADVTSVTTSDSESATAGVTPFKLKFRIRPGETSDLKITVDGTEVFNDTIDGTNMPPEIKVYEKAVIVIGKPIWVTTFKDGKRIPTPNRSTSYTLTLRNDAATQ